MPITYDDQHENLIKKWWQELKIYLIVTLLILSYANLANGKNIELINEKNVINRLKVQTNLPIVFPEKISQINNEGNLYLSAINENQPRKYWRLNIDADPKCNGAKYCNLGFVSAEAKGRLEKTYITLPDKKQHSKELVKLANNLIGYFTPFHVQAEGVNPSLEWQKNGILYTISWKAPGSDKAQKQALIDLYRHLICYSC